MSVRHRNRDVPVDPFVTPQQQDLARPAVTPPPHGGVPRTRTGTAYAAMLLAATTSNLVHARHIFAAVASRLHHTDRGPEVVWETEGGRLHITAVHADARRRHPTAPAAVPR